VPESTSNKPTLITGLTLDTVVVEMHTISFPDGETVTRQIAYHPKRASLESDPINLPASAYEHRSYVITDLAGQPTCRCSRSRLLSDEEVLRWHGE